MQQIALWTGTPSAGWDEGAEGASVVNKEEMKGPPLFIADVTRKLGLLRISRARNMSSEALMGRLRVRSWATPFIGNGPRLAPAKIWPACSKFGLERDRYAARKDDLQTK